MGHAKESQDEPENEAINQPKIEILSDLDDYQEKIESHWESAKANYQDKVNQILDEFIQQNIHSAPNDEAPKTDIPKKPFSEPIEPPTEEKVIPDFESGPDAEERLRRLLSRAEKVVRMADKKTRFTSPSFKPEPFQLGWHSEPFWSRWIGRSKKYLPWSAGVLALGFMLWFFLGVSSSYPLPYNHATGLVIDNKKIYVIDWFRKTLFIHDMKRGFPILSVENLPNQFMTGFSRTTNKVWSVDGLSHDFLIHSLTPDHIVTDKISSPGKKPVGLYFDGMDLWSMDDETKTLYRHHGNDLGDIKASYSIPSMNLSGLVVRKNKVWILSEKSRVIREFRLEDPLRELHSFDLDTVLEGANATSFALDDNNNMWLTTENPTKLLRIPVKKLSQ